MKLTEFFREQLDREVERSRKALEQEPDGQYQWKPHHQPTTKVFSRKKAQRHTRI
jgi:hypothetical protein